MNEIVFLSKRDRDRLAELNQMSGQLSSELLREQNDILAKRKPLAQMTISECQAMKTEINQKIAKIAAIGRLEHTRPMVMMIHQLDQRIDTLIRAPSAREQVNAQSIRSKARKANPLARPVRSRWTARTSVRGSVDGDADKTRGS